MSRQHQAIRVASVTLLESLMFGVVAAPVVMGRSDTASCRVSNVTQSTKGDSIAAMVRAAADGDELLVRGTCLARQVAIARGHHHLRCR